MFHGFQSRLSPNGLSKAKQMAAKCDKLVDDEKWTEATDCWDSMEGLIGEVGHVSTDAVKQRI